MITREELAAMRAKWLPVLQSALYGHQLRDAAADNLNLIECLLCALTRLDAAETRTITPPLVEKPMIGSAWVEVNQWAGIAHAAMAERDTALQDLKSRDEQTREQTQLRERLQLFLDELAAAPAEDYPEWKNAAELGRMHFEEFIRAHGEEAGQ